MTTTGSEALDFRHIRGELEPAKRDYFEQLVCHLAALDKSGELRRIHGAGGDGGVEAIRLLPNGGKIGYQAKYYPVADGIDWKAIDNSVTTALTHHPTLVRYVVALPCDFTGKRKARGGVTEGMWGKWDARVATWQAHAQLLGITVQFEAWTAFELERDLLKPAAHHLRQFFFNRLAFSEEWFHRAAQRTVAALQARYSPAEHVPTESQMPFDVIFRRQPLTDHLHEIFLTARESQPAAALSALGLPPDQLSYGIACETLLGEFLRLQTRVNDGFDLPWPLEAWFDRWHDATRNLTDLYHGATRHLPNDELTHRVSAMMRVTDLISPEIFGGHWARLLPVDRSRALLLVGRAGAGKSHALAHAAQTALASGAPVIHVLGQHILDHDPRVSILKQLDLAGWRFDDLLAALDLAAEAANTRAMLVIDGLNEGHGLSVWRNHLAALVSDVNRYERVVLAVSCREEYLDYVVPAGLIHDRHQIHRMSGVPFDPLGKLVQVEISGFRTMQEREAALIQFMDRNGIARPGPLMLDDELFNPLFLSSVCRSMAKAGIKVFPPGLHGTFSMFNFVLEAKASSLGSGHDGKPRLLESLRAALHALAAQMVVRQSDHLPLQQAAAVLQTLSQQFPVAGLTWLEILEGADILRRDVDGQAAGSGAWSLANEVVRFAFQRLQDNFLADQLATAAGDIGHAFAGENCWAFLVRHTKDMAGEPTLKLVPAWRGVLGALWAIVADRFGRELCDLPSFFGNPDGRYFESEMRAVFRASLRERAPTAFTARTGELFDILFHERWHEQHEVYLSCACIPGHPWNADYLARKLEAMSPEMLDNNFVHQFDRWQDGATRGAGQILSWLEAVDSAKADSEVLRLARLTARWLAKVDSSAIRDRAAALL
ncbi:hypothetical protein LJR289_001094 [Pseudoduganella sp. LjRoot289]|uniref:hypothetical protein n=1 Tax=Pseudoduganella sp. LjRoot289 TaxID=3342314 RepID=UPI003ECEBD1D